MSNNPRDLKKQEEACINHYLEDCKRIEGKQDDIAKQRSLLQEIEEQLAINSSKALEHYNVYAHSNDMRIYQAMNVSLCSMHFAESETQQRFNEYQEDLALEERKLATEREERDKQYKEEVRDLSKQNDESR